ncbi:kinase mkl1 MAPK-like protein, partial [Branchiostoma belcheri]
LERKLLSRRPRDVLVNQGIMPQGRNDHTVSICSWGAVINDGVGWLVREPKQCQQVARLTMLGQFEEMPGQFEAGTTALKSPIAFHEQMKSLERAKTGDLLQRKIRLRPDRQELIQQHILQGEWSVSFLVTHPFHASSCCHFQGLNSLSNPQHPNLAVVRKPADSQTLDIKSGDFLHRMCFDTNIAPPSLQANQNKLKRARLADDLNDKLAHAQRDH